MQKSDLEQYYNKYNKALEILQDKFNSLYLDYEHNSNDNPIEHIKYRIKTPLSIKEKIKKKLNTNININDIILSEELIDNYLSDVVGVRLVCSFKNDLEAIISKIKNDKDLIIIDEKDYINKPKTSGYKSYHIRVKVPVEIEGEQKYVKAEIQLRTIAMDMNASIEHILYYKKGISLPDKITKFLERTTDFCNLMDEELNNEILKRKNIKENKETIDLSLISNEEYNNLIPKYIYALNKINEKLSYMREDYKQNNLINPIEHINIRIKDKEATLRKLKKLGKDINIENIEEYINDMAGIRIVCPFKKNVYDIVDELKKDEELIVLKEKDYVANPKQSGYRSYHLIVLVPIYTEMGKIYVKSEIQIRSMAMDMWASLQRKLTYKKDVNLEIKKTLQEEASNLAFLDDNMDISYQESLRLQKEKIEREIVDKDSIHGIKTIIRPQTRIKTQKKVTIC